MSYNVPVPQRQYMASTGMGGGAAQQAWNVDEPATTPTYVPEPPPQPPVRRGSGTVQAQARGPAPPVPAPRPAPPPKPAHTAAPPASEPLDGSASNPFADDDDPFASPNQQQQDWALAARCVGWTVFQLAGVCRSRGVLTLVFGGLSGQGGGAAADLRDVWASGRQATRWSGQDGTCGYWRREEDPQEPLEPRRHRQGRYGAKGSVKPMAVQDSSWRVDVM